MLAVCVPPAPPLIQETTSFAPEVEETEIRVPNDIVNKFEVESFTLTVEEIIENKINLEDGYEKEEALYIIDLGVVLKKYKQ